jgi:hypothetical protein
MSLLWKVTFLTNNLTIFCRACKSFSGVSKQPCNFICSHNGKIKHTRIKVLLTRLCPFMKPFLKYTPSSPLYAAEKLQFNDYSALLFQFIGSWSPEMQFCVIYLEISASAQPHVAFWTSNFILVLLFLAECLIQCKDQCLLCLASVVGAFLLCLCFSG